MIIFGEFNRINRNKQAFFTLEALLGILMLVLALSWVITVIMKTQVVQDDIRLEDVARAHAEFIVSELQRSTPATLVENIRDGHWNYPNMPSIAAVGMIPLPGESIITEIVSEGTPRVVITVSWLNQQGETKTKVVEMMLGQ